MNKKRIFILVMFAMLFALSMLYSFAVSPSDIVIRRDDAAVVQIAAFNGTFGSGFGQKVLQADMNNDGYTDLIVGAGYKNLSGGASDYSGQVYIFYGNSQGFHSYDSSQANVTFNGTFQSTFGTNMLADDLNNDTYNDLLIGAYYKNLSGGAWDFTGQVSIFYGSADGMHSYASSDANVTLNGTSPSYFGYPDPILADMNNDSYKDLIISAIGKNLSGGKLANMGQVYVFYSSAGSFRSYTAAEANLTFNGTVRNGYFGAALLASELNNDTYTDLVIGARGVNISGGVGDLTGQVYLFYNSPGGMRSYSSVNANVTFNGTLSEDTFGDQTIYAGYINNDSYKDLVINARSARVNASTNINLGVIAFFYGSADGFHPYTRYEANVSINGTFCNDNHFGEFFSFDDFNGDGYKDLLATANQMNLTYGLHSQQGQAYLFYGNADGFSPKTAYDANFTLNASGGNNYLFGYTLAVSNFNNYSYKGFATGAWGENLSGGIADNTGRVYIYSFNFPPTISSVSNQSWNEDTSITINLSQYISDINNDNPNITWTTPADVSVSVDEATNVVTLTPNADWYGTEYIVFYANDTFNGLVASNNITLSVSNTADCGDATCDASETCTSCSVDCGACASTPGSSGNVMQQSGYTFAQVAADTPLAANFERLAVSRIEFIASEEISNVKINVKETSLPSSTTAPSGGINAYIEIDAPKLAGKLKQVKIKFSVEKKWLEENGFNANEIVLQRLTDKVWRELTTGKLSEDASKAYYEAITPGFSLFAITAKKAVEEVVEEATETSEEPVKEEEPETPVIAEKQSKAWIYTILIIALGVIAGAFFFLKAKHKPKKHRH